MQLDRAKRRAEYSTVNAQVLVLAVGEVERQRLGSGSGSVVLAALHRAVVEHERPVHFGELRRISTRKYANEGKFTFCAFHSSKLIFIMYRVLDH